MSFMEAKEKIRKIFFCKFFWFRWYKNPGLDPDLGSGKAWIRIYQGEGTPPPSLPPSLSQVV